MNGKFQIFTDTAALCLYDLAALKHRVEDTPDWWSIAEDELTEVNAGNCLFLNLGEDGQYEVTWSLDDAGKELKTAPVYHLRVPSGNVYLGAADDVSGGELEPDESCGGVLLQIEPGNYACMILRESNQIWITIKPSLQSENSLNDLIRI
ncbi:MULTISPECIES: DUF6386 family protein [unclassified Paenibacillus]|uniref:DUF6386 family protein n=1 Tax=unclassified Paenibacillus TaxID=185978 RepID=UPI0009A5AD2C|nr:MULTISPECIES: DUF6386 family protein [unclassified Paenibacillus]SLK12087.1 hypothetical protein SAMN06272722_107284 [Paenibacillus sp. RU5A]SOC72516.1 hypothetical protein SAMN05880581_107284 [Paenibacillus sp. RU26A]SOC74933.1 hypothetical protein SAMN05880586_107284 [Paenibacillus sp. RU5M]